MHVKFSGGGRGVSGDSGLAAGLDDLVVADLVNRMDRVLEASRSGAGTTDFFYSNRLSGSVLFVMQLFIG